MKWPMKNPNYLSSIHLIEDTSKQSTIIAFCEHTSMAFLQAWYCPFFFFACEHWHVCIQQIRLHAQVSEWFRGLWTQIWYSNLRYSVNQVLENSNQINHLKKDKIQHLTCKWSRTMRWSSFAVPQMTFNTRFTPCQWRRN
jgi:hypothetical protein